MRASLRRATETNARSQIGGKSGNEIEQLAFVDHVLLPERGLAVRPLCCAVRPSWSVRRHCVDCPWAGRVAGVERARHAGRSRGNWASPQGATTFLLAGATAPRSNDGRLAPVRCHSSDTRSSVAGRTLDSRRASAGRARRTGDTRSASAKPFSPCYARNPKRRRNGNDAAQNRQLL